MSLAEIMNNLYSMIQEIQSSDYIYITTTRALWRSIKKDT